MSQQPPVDPATSPSADLPTSDEPARADTMTPATPVTPVEPARTPSKREQKAIDPLRGSTAGGIYAAIIGLGIVLILLIIFIAQNTRKVEVHFLGFEGQTPLAVALLIAAAAGLFLAGIASLLRIIQLRSRVKHDRKARRAR